MTDLSKCTPAELEAEIERRKAEPDYAAWEPKWQAFCKVAGYYCSSTWERAWKKLFIRALIAAHNTPLAREDDPDEGWTYWDYGMIVPEEVSLDTHEAQYRARHGGRWIDLYTTPSWASGCYRYRPKQTDEVRP